MLPQAKLNPEVVSVLAANAQGIDHVAIAVRNLEEALPFYLDVLGFTVGERRETAGKRTGMRSVVLNGGPVSLVLVQGTSPESQVCRFIDAYGPGVQHMAIRVNNLTGVIADLQSRGLNFVTNLIRSRGLLQAFAVRDENSGMMVELIERVNDTEGFSDNNVDQLFQQMEASDSF